MADAAELRTRAANAALEKHKKKTADDTLEMKKQLRPDKLESTAPYATKEARKSKGDEDEDDDDDDKKKPKLGSGKRFKQLSSELKKGGKSQESADKIAASIGRKKYGNKKMNKLSAAGKKREGY